MRRKIAAFLGLVLWAVPGTAFGQAIDAVGSRALGMGGAFVAVADDASGAHWNPAALAVGQPAGALVEWNGFRRGDRDAAPTDGGWQRSSRFMSFGSWPVGVTYTRIDQSALTPGNTATRLLTQSYGLSLLQSLSNSFVVGTTLRYIRGRAAHEVVSAGSVGQALDDIAGKDGRGSGAFDLDLSAIFNAGIFRLGGTIRHMRSPTFAAPDGTELELARRSRVGIAVLPVDGLTLAMDIDLDTVTEPDGERRTGAIGVEHRLSPRVIVRAGARRNFAGDHENAGTAGASFAIRPGTWLDGHLTFGGSTAERGFGLALRAGW
ncbi:MAG: hypothetical protein AMXMBFR57_31010 [Acidimicrobiia bacterium]|jgi:hypothetical protein